MLVPLPNSVRTNMSRVHAPECVESTFRLGNASLARFVPTMNPAGPRRFQWLPALLVKSRTPKRTAASHCKRSTTACLAPMCRAHAESCRRESF